MTIESLPAGFEDEAVLRQAVLVGDERAFRSLYRRHSPRLNGLLSRMLNGHVADTEDALQETWIRAVSSLDRYRADSTFATWLGGIGVRVAWELIRKRRPWVELEVENPVAEDAATALERIDLEEALRRLPEVQRIVVVLHDIEGFTHDEIAASLAVATSTSRSHLFRGRRALRCLLQSCEGAYE